ncbi:HAD-IA family hydrolase [Miniphocaeibacter halophilus]|uniref:HAD-IA family hydrolase n=1 Tax=Miniphocaeibacter halophilus TaxID=2931922 RepID=A0AC61MNU9_9FIRM|nr:HAD-IA family hydrolase [Miniphocaeibacter halophilus]QQK07190.1 HAD-IA family hydrolase [Miniphocaeibacter halophilus]
MKKQFFLFDLDGTIIDSGEGIKNAIRYSLNKEGIEENREEVLNSFIGPPLVDSYMENYNFTREKAIEVVNVYREYYGRYGVYENRLYDGIVDVIKKLKEQDNKIILATSKPEIFAREVMKQHKLTDYFDFIGGASLDHKIAHKNEVLQYIMDNIKIEKEKSFMIGDTKFDILGGRKFNLKTVGVTYGYGSLEELKESKADYIVNKPLELLTLFKGD